eukprot:4221076-Amphidinium_carterae.1
MSQSKGIGLSFSKSQHARGQSLKLNYRGGVGAGRNYQTESVLSGAHMVTLAWSPSSRDRADRLGGRPEFTEEHTATEPILPQNNLQSTISLSSKKLSTRWDSQRIGNEDCAKRVASTTRTTIFVG